MDKKMYIKYKNKRYIWNISRFKEHMLLTFSIILFIIVYLWASGEDYKVLMGM